MDAKEAALKTFQLENNIKTDQIYEYNSAEQQAILNAKPWLTDPKYFKNVKISAIALTKMLLHARSGGDIEVMGLMQGKVVGDTMIVMDAFALPVQGTETRVNAQAEGYEYMYTIFIPITEKIGKTENAIGWYHSHPGYGCWLSGIDVSTQMLNQQYQEPFLAVVIDPKRSVSTGKVDLGAFRTFQQDYNPGGSLPVTNQSIPLEKMQDFGAHSNQYYPLDVSYFKSSTDDSVIQGIWSRYWMNTVASCPCIDNYSFITKQIVDLTKKLEPLSDHFGSIDLVKKKKEESPIHRCCQDASKIGVEALTALMVELLKKDLFIVE